MLERTAPLEPIAQKNWKKSGVSPTAPGAPGRGVPADNAGAQLEGGRGAAGPSTLEGCRGVQIREGVEILQSP